MILPYDPVREAIVLELNQAICARRAQGVSWEAIGLEYGLSKETLQLFVNSERMHLSDRFSK
jgi:hypothetical protein